LTGLPCETYHFVILIHKFPFYMQYKKVNIIMPCMAAMCKPK
jgi:hypothetical protein